MKPLKKQSLKPFVKKCCIIAENAKYPALELYLTYVNWCLNYGKTVHDQFTFLDMLEEQGFPYSSHSGSTLFKGISVPAAISHRRLTDPHEIHRHPHRRCVVCLRGFPLSHADQVWRRRVGSRDDPQRRMCRPHPRRQTGSRFGSMPMGNIWAFPSKTLGYDQTLAAMKAVVERVAAITRSCSEFGHPIDLTWALEHEFTVAAQTASETLRLADPIPVLCTLVVGARSTPPCTTLLEKCTG